MEHAIILAGGSGTRLWPMSRHNRPKQLLPLVQGRSLLELTIERLSGVFPPQRTWIVTRADLSDAVRSVATGLPEANVIGEPLGRDTSNAIGLACLLLNERDPHAKVGVFTADHVIRPTDRFAAAVRDAFSLLDEIPDAIVTFGVLPSWPHTGLGYVHRGAELASRFHTVRRFIEKPDRVTAERLVSSGEYYWNSGMFAFSAQTAVEGLKLFAPDQFAVLSESARALRNGDMAAAAELYARLPKISIDYALMEPASNSPAGRLVVRELDCQWLDLGSWTVLSEVNQTDEAGNLHIGCVTALDTAGNVVASDDAEHLIAAIGIEDLVIVHSADATLIAPKARAQDLKRLLELVRQQHGQRYL